MIAFSFASWKILDLHVYHWIEPVMKKKNNNVNSLSLPKVHKGRLIFLLKSRPLLLTVYHCRCKYTLEIQRDYRSRANGEI